MSANSRPARVDEAGRSCPYCRFPLKPGTGVAECGSCHAVHHDECWEEGGGCAVVGCNATSETRTLVTPAAPPPRPASPATALSRSRTPWSLAVAGVTLVVVLVAAAVVLLGGDDSSGGDPPAQARAATTSAQPAAAPVVARPADATITIGKDQELTVAGGQPWTVKYTEYVEPWVYRRRDEVSGRADGLRTLEGQGSISASDGRSVQALERFTGDYRTLYALYSGEGLSGYPPALHAYDTDTGERRWVHRMPDASIQFELAPAGDVAWLLLDAAGAEGKGQIRRLDVDTGRVLGRTDLDFQCLPRVPAAFEDIPDQQTQAGTSDALYLLFASTSCGRSSLRIRRIGADGTVGPLVPVAVGEESGVAVAGGTVWLSDAARGAVTPLDPDTLKPLGSPVPVGRGAAAMAEAGGDLWVMVAGDRTVVRVDAKTAKVIERYQLSFVPRRLGATDTALWVSGRTKASRIDVG
ncbi:hypothetical protein AB0L40_21105 [Patulibacter sp. NPDC049589]|uniref:hypothetical protein n=1 Tax=Patulibacter sp. NPDC049589 TaxID=3154731 RepID=UPI0034181B49